LNAARDLFAPALTGWSVEHQGNLTTADGDDGALVTVRSATLTAHGWGLEVVLTGGQPSGAEEGLSYAAALNRAESAPAHPRPAGSPAATRSMTARATMARPAHHSWTGSTAAPASQTSPWPSTGLDCCRSTSRKKGWLPSSGSPRSAYATARRRRRMRTPTPA